MWTLILTVIISRSADHAEMTTIQGFETKYACETAGHHWYTDVSKGLKPYYQDRDLRSEVNYGRHYTYTCVEVR